MNDCMTQKLSFFAEEVIAVAEVARILEIEDALRWFYWQFHQLCSNASPSALRLAVAPRSCIWTTIAI